ncbi:MAG: hypothetical protein ACRERU_05175 [Methylococcales bacterium]
MAEVQEGQPDYPAAAEQIAALQQKQQHQEHAEHLVNRLLTRLQEILPVFMDVATVLKNVSNHAKAQAIVEKTEQFLRTTITADAYIRYCRQELSAQTPQRIGTAMDYDEFAKRIRNGDTVLFLGSELPRQYGETITDEHQLASHLAQKAGYPKFSGTFSVIAEYYQLRPEYGRKDLLDKLSKTLSENSSVIRFYRKLARIEQLLVLIASHYDDSLETIFQQYHKPFVVLSSIICRSEGYDVGHVLVEYSDNKEPE